VAGGEIPRGHPTYEEWTAEVGEKCHAGDLKGPRRLGRFKPFTLKDPVGLSTRWRGRSWDTRHEYMNRLKKGLYFSPIHVQSLPGRLRPLRDT